VKSGSPRLVSMSTSSATVGWSGRPKQTVQVSITFDIDVIHIPIGYESLIATPTESISVNTLILSSGNQRLQLYLIDT